MSIDQKFFSADKNYLLKTVQAFSKERHLNAWTELAYEAYLNAENPLGLLDDFTISLKKEIEKGSFILSEAYDIISAIYRLKNDSNQLSFMWDGRTHMEYYEEEWTKAFTLWCKELSANREVYRIIIKASLADDKVNTDFLSASLRRFILKKFKLRLSRANRLSKMYA